MYSVLNKLLEYIYFYISKNITSNSFGSCFQNRSKPLLYPSTKSQYFMKSENFKENRHISTCMSHL